MDSFESQQDAARPSSDAGRCNVSDEVWSIVELAASQNGMLVSEYVEKALLDEAIILEQTRLGRAWLVRDERGRLGTGDFR